MVRSCTRLLHLFLPPPTPLPKFCCFTRFLSLRFFFLITPCLSSSLSVFIICSGTVFVSTFLTFLSLSSPSSPFPQCSLLCPHCFLSSCRPCHLSPHTPSYLLLTLYINPHPLPVLCLHHLPFTQPSVCIYIYLDLS